MENLAPSSALSPLLRPILTLQADVGALMREGRTLAGEVLGRLDGGTYVLSLAGHRVSAESRVELEVGSTQRFEVVRVSGELVLRPVEAAPSGNEAPLLRALRVLSGAEPSLQGPLETLEVLLAAMTTSSSDGGARLAELLATIARRIFDPASGEAGLRALLVPNGPGSAVALLAALVEGGADANEPVLHAFATALAGALDRALRRVGLQAPAVDGSSILQVVEQALEQVLAQLALPEVETLGRQQVQELALVLQRALVRKLREHGPRSQGELLARMLDEGGPGMLLERGELALLRLLFQERGSSWGKGLREVGLRQLESDLAGSLLALLPDLPAGEVREAALRTLHSLELERVLQHARHEGGEPTHQWFLVPDDGGRARVDLLLERRPPENPEEPEHGDSWRLALGVDFRALGPVRADLLLRRDDMILRIAAERPATVARLQLALPALEQALQSLGRRAEIRILQAAEGEASLEEAAHQIRFLREHHLMDVRG